MNTKTERAAQNGQAKNTDTKNGANNTELLKGKEETKVVKLPVNPIDERTRKIAELQKLTMQRHTLLENEKDLHAFSLGSDKSSDSLVIKDSERNTFETSNTYLITKVVEVLKSEFAVKHAEIDAQLLSASI